MDLNETLCVAEARRLYHRALATRTDQMHRVCRERDEANRRGDGLAADLATCVRLRDQALAEVERLRAGIARVIAACEADEHDARAQALREVLDPSSGDEGAGK
jgi:hypothetical protein